MHTLIIEGGKIHDIASFYDEINRLFMSGADWKIGHSLDAFNDVLYGGFSEIAPGEPVLLIWKDIEKSSAALGYETTKAYYQGKLGPHSPYNQELFREKLAALETGNGQTYFDIILEIIAGHPNIILQKQ